MKERPILVALIGYIIGILWGLYLKVSIVPFYILIIATYYILKKFLKINKNKKFKLISFSHYKKYLKLIVNSKVIVILILSSIISNVVVSLENNRYEKIYKNKENVELEGIVVSQKIEKQYYNIYKVKMLNNTNLFVYIQVRKEQKELEYGDFVSIKGEYKKPSVQRNYKGYDEEKYLKTLKIVGKIKVNKIEVKEKRKVNILLLLGNKINLKVKEKLDIIFEKEQSAILKGLLLGDKEEIDNEVRENFQTANISHVLAISGMHISYIIIGIQFLLEKIFGKRKTKIITVMMLILYIFITGFSPSIIRAVVMGILLINAELLHRKNDIWNSIAIFLFCILLYNPFSIFDIGLQLSYMGTIGIILFNSTILEILVKSEKESKILVSIKKIMAVTISAQIVILPVLLINFHIVGIYFIITNLFVSIIIGPLIICAFLCIILSFIFQSIAKILCIPLEIGLNILNFISKISKLPLAKIYIPTPNICFITLYFIIIFIFKYIYAIYNSNILSTTQKRIKNILELLKYKFRLKKKRYVKIFIIIVILIVSLNFVPKGLKIYFVDVGQGDCTFIVTPQNKTILIDGGGSITGDFDVGKNTLIPYLLNRGYAKIDYVIISHFDQDHVGGIITVLEELSVKNIIIGKQFEDSENYRKFLQIVDKKKIKVNVVEAGNKVNIEKNLYFEVLWPNSKQMVQENSINNNALVCKLNYKKFSMLFTGDIEEEAEKILISKYQNTEVLKSTVLKVAHHGSKTSSTQEFLNLVKPKIALIGVGENNTFGHPNEEVIQRLENLRE